MSRQDGVADLQGVPTADIGEARDGRGIFPARIRPLSTGTVVSGRALPVKCPGGENLTIHRAIYEALPGDILVVGTGEPTECGYWGDIMTLAAVERGIAGLIIDGCVRDTESIRAHGFPVFASGTAIRGTAKTGSGTIGEELTIGDATVRTGDFVSADGDGIVAVPAGTEDAVFARVQERQAKEIRVRELLRQGRTTLEIFGWSDFAGPPARPEGH